MTESRLDKPLILLLEDELQIRRFVASALAEQGWQCMEAATLAAGRDSLARQRPALLILDLGLPDGDGVDFIRELRAWTTIPILVLSARSDEREIVAALDAGADDYLSKPFGVRELAARVRAQLRRSGPTDNAGEVIFGDVCVDRAHRRVERNGEPVHLTPIEYQLLQVLLAHAGRVITHRQLLREVWGTATGETHYVRIYVGHLRQKLERDPTRPRHLLTEIGVGYRFQLDE